MVTARESIWRELVIDVMAVLNEGNRQWTPIVAKNRVDEASL